MKFYRKRSKKAPRLRKYSTKAKKVSPVVKSYVNKAIHRNIENKRFTIETSKTMAGSGNAANFQSGNIYQLTPSSNTNSLYTITQSSSEAGRTGNEIMLRNAVFRYCLYPLTYNITSNPTPKPLDVMIFIFSVKRGVQGVTVADAWNIFNNTIFCNGASSNGTTNNMFDIVSVFNEDVVKLHYKKIVKLAPSNSQLQTGVNAGWTNNDYKYNCFGRINVTKYLPKRITFNDADNNSTSRQVFLFMAPYNADGTTIASTSFVSAAFTGLDLKYEDA